MYYSIYIAASERERRRLAGQLHIITGIPGTRIQRSLDKLASYEETKGNSRFAGFVSLEEKFRELARPEIHTFYRGAPAESPLAVFLLPKPKLRDLWVRAFDEACTEVQGHLTADRDVILTLHLCWFHHQYREYLGIANYFSIREVLGGDSLCGVITLIDDVFDCQRQLFTAGQMFGKPEDPESAALNALFILDWRSKEILLSDTLAWHCGVPFLIFAVKHPIGVFSDLLYSRKPRIYLSHPITELRRLRKEDREADAHVVIEELKELVDDLSANHVVFEPTSIDEFRFRLDESGGFLGNLDQRWPFTAEPRDLLYVPPTTSGEPIQTAYPAGWDSDDRPDLPEGPSFRSLRQAILGQISARDHWLVEQVDRLVCYRPIFEGHASTGVEEELLHVSRLENAGLEQATPLVFSKAEDRAAFAPRHLWEIAIDEWQAGSYVDGPNEAFDALREELRSGGAAEIDEICHGRADAVIALCDRHGLRIRPRATPDMVGGALGVSDEVKRHAAASHLADSVITANERLYLDRLEQSEKVRIFPSIGELLAGLAEEGGTT